MCLGPHSTIRTDYFEQNPARHYGNAEKLYVLPVLPLIHRELNATIQPGSVRPRTHRRWCDYYYDCRLVSSVKIDQLGRIASRRTPIVPTRPVVAGRSTSSERDVVDIAMYEPRRVTSVRVSLGGSRAFVTCVTCVSDARGLCAPHPALAAAQTHLWATWSPLSRNVSSTYVPRTAITGLTDCFLSVLHDCHCCLDPRANYNQN